MHVQFEPQSAQVFVSSSDTARPPDGGWGWVVVFASFMVNLISVGIVSCIGFYYPSIFSHFHERSGVVMWILHLFYAMPLLSGRIAVFLIDKYGCRIMTIIGSILAALGLFVCINVNGTVTLLLAFVIMTGFGLSLCNVATVVIVAYYFEKKRSLATGISACGSLFSGYLFSPLIHFLLDQCEVHETLLILALLLLNLAICGLFFRDPAWTAAMNEERTNEHKRRIERKKFVLSVSKSSAAESAKVTDNTLGNYETTIVKEKSQWLAGLWEVLVELLDFSHFRKPAFLAFAVSNFLLYTWFNTFYSHNDILHKGVPMAKVSMLQFVVMMMNLFSAILIGWVGGQECVNPSLLNAVCMVLGGTVWAIVPLLTTSLGLTVALAAFEAFAAVNYTLTSTILVKQITLKKFTNAYGLLLLIQGLARLIRPTLAVTIAWLDINSSDDLVFYLGGVSIGASGLILIIVQCYNVVRRCYNHQTRYDVTINTSTFKTTN
ncbi:monocarboxylate transporter 3-like [Pararge aegeria]|nr:monocarboxylate transporter 3-like [Pararge aegeria]